ncbi:hypothetical protein BX666DRAFT_1873442 [Dichotomocladium elegans]|nr:hypothetical protein BX666DRAFT_1873442 [Dichotomocladium elegans]
MDPVDIEMGVSGGHSMFAYIARIGQDKGSTPGQRGATSLRLSSACISLESMRSLSNSVTGGGSGPGPESPSEAVGCLLIGIPIYQLSPANLESLFYSLVRSGKKPLLPELLFMVRLTPQRKIVVLGMVEHPAIEDVAVPGVRYPLITEAEVLHEFS